MSLSAIVISHVVYDRSKRFPFQRHDTNPSGRISDIGIGERLLRRLLGIGMFDTYFIG